MNRGELKMLSFWSFITLRIRKLSLIMSIIMARIGRNEMNDCLIQPHKSWQYISSGSILIRHLQRARCDRQRQFQADAPFMILRISLNHFHLSSHCVYRCMHACERVQIVAK